MTDSPSYWQDHRLTAYQLEKLAEDEPEQKTLLGPFKSGQVGFIAAPGGTGKSMLALQLMKSISLGEDFGPWKGHGGMMPGTVIDAELTHRDLVQRIKSLDAWGAPLKYDTFGLREKAGAPHFSLGNPEHQAWLQAVAAHESLIVIDNVTFTLDPAPGYNLYAPETIAQMRPLMSWARAANVLLILIDHTNRAGELSGSLNKHRLADWVVTLEADEPDPLEAFRFELKWDKYRGNDAPRDTYRFAMTHSGLWDHSKVLSLGEQVRELIAAGATKKDVSQELEISLRTVQRHCR